ncbi:hypothetical protein GALL_222630 [mine drainage metagenome]|uniref:Uncharacterized protein n=1 Tax=mine drainage metagenome TaxID=410659 RepID=A0A1J5RUP5_9ZZZZ
MPRAGSWAPIDDRQVHGRSGPSPSFGMGRSGGTLCATRASMEYQIKADKPRPHAGGADQGRERACATITNH